MKLKKALACAIYLMSILNLNCLRINAMTAVATGASIALSTGGSIIGYLPEGITLIDRFLKWWNDDAEKKYKEEVKIYGGYRSKCEIADNLDAINKGKSPIKIYGQNEAKKDCHKFLTSALEEIFNNGRLCKSTCGNVIYIIGPPGTGKTVMANAIADAFLKYKDHTCCVICPEEAKSDSSSGPSGDLASRLFKVTNKILNLEKKPTSPGFWRRMSGKDKIEQSSRLVLAPIPYHLFKWKGEAVIILDDYDKMKTSISQYTNAVTYDNSADEIFRSIVSNGYYMINGEKIDCSKALFIITSNETKEDIYKNFGQGGVAGGAPRRLNIAKFESADTEFGGRLVSDMVSKICFTLTNKSDIYRVKNVKFSEDTIKSMADHITNNKVKQGGAIKDLKSGILSVCAQHRSEFAFKSIEISYIPNEDPDVVGDFTACVLTKDNDTAKASQDDGTESKSERKKKCEFEVFSDDEDDCHELNSNDGDDCLELNSSDE